MRLAGWSRLRPTVRQANLSGDDSQAGTARHGPTRARDTRALTSANWHRHLLREKRPPQKHQVLIFVETSSGEVLTCLRGVEDNLPVSTQNRPGFQAVLDLLVSEASLIASCREHHR